MDSTDLKVIVYADTADKNVTSKCKSNQNKLVESISKILIIAHKENTQELETALNSEGFRYEVLRQEPKPEYKNYSRSYLCLQNHVRAWEIAAKQSQPSLIIEADFVPVIGFGKLPLPFDPLKENVGVGWLYTCASQVYSISPEGYAEGFSVSTVAYVVTPKAASVLPQLAAEITQRYGATNYSSWDSTMDSFLRQRKFKNYIPWRNYGEHGGVPNPEHQQNNLSKTHRADVLYGKLAFLPGYAVGLGNPKINYIYIRLEARLKGLARLLTGRFIRPKVLKVSKKPIKLLIFAFGRQFSLNNGK